MIEKQKIGERDAVVSYLTSALEPAEKDDATLIKVTFEDDQSSFWLTPRNDDGDEEPAEDSEPKPETVLSKIGQMLKA